MFAVRQACEMYLANGKDVFWTFMDLKNVYDTIYQHGMRQLLSVYGVRGILLKAMQNFYLYSRVCVLGECILLSDSSQCSS